MVQESRLRVGAVSFLNTKPLIYPLLSKEIQTDIALSVDVPSRVATLLSEGELDVGLIPIIEYFRANPSGTHLCILPEHRTAASKASNCSAAYRFGKFDASHWIRVPVLPWHC